MIGADGAITVVVRAIYGLNLASASFHKNLYIKLSEGLGLKECLSEPYTWIKPSCKSSTFKYYKYISIYVDYRMTLRDVFDNTIKGLDWTYTLEEVKGPFNENPR